MANPKNKVSGWLIILLIAGGVLVLFLGYLILSIDSDDSNGSGYPWWVWVFHLLVLYLLLRFLFFNKKKAALESGTDAKKWKIKELWEKYKPKKTKWIRPTVLLIALALVAYYFFFKGFSFSRPSFGSENSTTNSSSQKEEAYQTFVMGEPVDMAPNQWFKYTIGYDEGGIYFDAPDKKGLFTLYFEKAEDRSTKWSLTVWYEKGKKCWRFSPRAPLPEVAIGTTYVKSENDATVVVSKRKKSSSR